MTDRDDETQERGCRACDKRYVYPVPRSLATRFYCAECMTLPPAVRATFEQFNRRLRKLAATVSTLEQELSKPPTTSRSNG